MRMRMQFLKRIALTVASLVIAAVPLHAQSGAILGAVSDASGAFIPGVTITVTNEGTNQKREVLTNETGNYRVEPLPSGFTYTVAAELAGFRREVRTKVP